MNAKVLGSGLALLAGMLIVPAACGREGDGTGRSVEDVPTGVAATLGSAANEVGSRGGGGGDDTDDGDRDDHPGDNGKTFVYVGSHDSGASGTATGQIEVFSLNPRTGRLVFRSAVARTDQNLIDHPDFLAFDTRRGRLFAVSENFFDPTAFESAVASFAIDRASGALTFLSARPTGFSFDPFEFTLGAVHLAIDSRGAHLLVALFGDAALQIYPVDGAGLLGPRQQEIAVGDEPHQIALDQSERTALVPCLGSDEVRQLTYDGATGTLAPAATPSVATPPLSGPRHLAFSRDNRFVYLVDEVAATVSSYRFSGGSLGALPLQSRSTLPPHPAAFDRLRAAEVAVAPDGRLLFVSTRLDAAQPDGTFAPLEGYLTVFRLNRDGGGLTLVAAVRVGKEPRHFSVDPDGRFLIVANQFSDSVVSYRIDRDSGDLTQVDTEAVSHPEFAGAVRLDR
jgi:6-phosphogluconolactonase